MWKKRVQLIGHKMVHFCCPQSFYGISVVTWLFLHFPWDKLNCLRKNFVTKGNNYPQNRPSGGGEGTKKLSESYSAPTRHKWQGAYCVKSKKEKSDYKKETEAGIGPGDTANKIESCPLSTMKHDGDSKGKMERRKEENVKKIVRCNPIKLYLAISVVALWSSVVGANAQRRLCRCGAAVPPRCGVGGAGSPPRSARGVPMSWLCCCRHLLLPTAALVPRVKKKKKKERQICCVLCSTDTIVL